jgi:hypothetical protein
MQSSADQCRILLYRHLFPRHPNSLSSLCIFPVAEYNYSEGVAQISTEEKVFKHLIIEHSYRKPIQI